MACTRFSDDRAMTFTNSARRGIATATGGLVVVGAGAASGLIIADMHATWADQAALEAASAVAAQQAEIAAVPPVVVTKIKERHVTPDPVIVRKKVYRTRIVGGTTGQPRQSAPRRTTSSGSSRPAASAPKPRKPRTVVAPAPKAPAKSSGQASSGTTSKRS